MSIRLARDKWLHVLAGVVLAILVSVFESPAAGLGVAISAGVLKESYDWFDYGRFDFMDMFATCIGGLVVFLMFFRGW